MARMTSLDLVGYVRRSCGSPTTDELSNSDILRILNSVVIELTSDYDFSESQDSFTLTTVASTQQYNFIALASDVQTLNYGLIASLGQRIKEISRDKFVRMNGPSTSNTGTPTYFWVSSSTTLELFPIPDTVYTVTFYYKATQPELVLSPASAIDSLNLPQVWDMIVADKAVVCALTELEKPDQASDFYKLKRIPDRENKAWVATRPKNIPRRKVISGLSGVRVGN